MTRFKKDSVGDTIESWIEHEVAPALDRLKADPSRALSLNGVRAALAIEHARAVLERKDR